MAERRFVFDTNVLVSAALFPGSVPRQAIDKAMGLGKLILSERVAEELAEILGRERFDRYVSQLSRNRFLATLIAQADILDIHEFLQVCRDPKDDKFLDLAVAGEATCIVTGDKDLLVLDPFRGIPIVTPRRFLDEFVPAEGESARNGPAL